MTSLAQPPRTLLSTLAPATPPPAIAATPTLATSALGTSTATEPTEALAAPSSVVRDFGAVRGGVRVVLRLEALAAFVASLVAYHHLGGSWSTFAWLFLVPDLAFVGYLAGPRVGAVAYDATHSWLGPAALALFGRLAGLDVLWLVAIWSAHLGFDRALGYGLKYATSFTHTHLGAIGRPPRTEAKARETK